MSSTGTSSLKDFLRNKKIDSESRKQETDWAQRRDRWKKSVEKLYQDIQSWLSEAVTEGIVQFEFDQKGLNEEYVGEYSIATMRMVVGEQSISFQPMGTMILGADGRVDMEGREGAIMLVLLDDVWNIADREKRPRYWPLTAESFDEAVRQVME